LLPAQPEVNPTRRLARIFVCVQLWRR
jgi:hypothetical protein